METFGRIRKSPAKEFAELDSQHLDEAVALFPFQYLIHRAHVVMLQETGILDKVESSKILNALFEVKKEVEKEPRLAIYMNTERYVIAQVGEVGGKMHIGRSRNDLNSTTYRMYVRDQLLNVMERLIDLWKTLLDIGERNVEVVMPGYTHWQHAQPITFGHYLTAHADACERVLKQLENAYEMTNFSPLGAGALAGTGWHINRERTAQLLGFSGVLENTLDAIASRDFMAEAAAEMALLLSNLSRMAEELEMWSSFEFSMVDIDEQYAGTSSIMPQKKNPSALEHVKAHAASAVGQLVEIYAALKGIAYTNVRDHNECIGAIRRLAANTLTATSVMKGIVSTLALNGDLMVKRAAVGFSTMTELADALVRESGLSFRTAHQIIANLVNDAIEHGKIATDVTGEMLNEASVRATGKALHLPEEKIHSALDPIKNVNERHAGGPAPEEVRRMINRGRKMMMKCELEQFERRATLTAAYKGLEEAERAILQSA